MQSRLWILSCLALIVLSLSVHAQDKKTTALEPAVDAILDKALKDFEAPGVAVAIVKGDSPVYLKGRGVRDLTKPSPVTPDTVFAIASCSKAFTATAIGFLVAEGKMDWDDPVRKHLPDFRMSDPLADREVTIRDLLCHRTGVIRHDILWVVHPWDRAEMIRRSGYLKPDKSFRSVWGYNNLQYLAAGEASARVAGCTWEQLVQSRLFDPLGMKSSNFSTRDLEKAKDHARPHACKNIDDGPIAPIQPLNIDNLAPAGSINSTVRDLSAWVRFQLGKGVFAGKRLLKAEVLQQTHTPVAVVPPPPGALAAIARKLDEGVTVQRNYALGWGVHDYRGRHVLSHGGSLDGYRSQVTLLPNEKIGIVVLTNLARTPLPSAVTNSLLDLLLKAPRRDWNTLYLDAEKARVDDQKLKEVVRAKKRKQNTRPSLELAGYTGTFEDAAHGRIEVRTDGGILKLNWGKYSGLALEHWHFDTFRIKDVPGLYPEAWGDRLLVFRFNTAGEIESFHYLGHEFKKLKTSPKRS